MTWQPSEMIHKIYSRFFSLHLHRWSVGILFLFGFMLESRWHWRNIESSTLCGHHQSKFIRPAFVKIQFATWCRPFLHFLLLLIYHHLILSTEHFVFDWYNSIDLDFSHVWRHLFMSFLFCFHFALVIFSLKHMHECVSKYKIMKCDLSLSELIKFTCFFSLLALFWILERCQPPHNWPKMIRG